MTGTDPQLAAAMVAAYPADHYCTTWRLREPGAVIVCAHGVAIELEAAT
jgi:hypothetical protein